MFRIFASQYFELSCTIPSMLVFLFTFQILGTQAEITALAQRLWLDGVLIKYIFFLMTHKITTVVNSFVGIAKRQFRKCVVLGHPVYYIRCNYTL